MTGKQIEFINELTSVHWTLGKWAALEIRSGSTIDIVKHKLREAVKKVDRD